MLVRNQDSIHVDVEKRKVRSLYKWISRISGLEVCWIEGLDNESRPIWACIKKLARGKLGIHFHRNSRRIITATALGAVLAMGSTEVSAQSSLQLSPGGFVQTFNGPLVSGDSLGKALAIGDINGDGFGDLILGVPNIYASGYSAAGRTYVVFGTSVGFSNFVLSTLNGSTGFVLNGSNEYDEAGSAVATADINGDGKTDLIIGAPLADPNGSSSGKTYVVFGSSSFASSIDLSGLNGTSGFVLNGVDAADKSGQSLATGDVNKDGKKDILIGAPGSSAGEAYVVFGSSSFNSSIDLSSLNGSSGFVINGVTAGDETGGAVASGDINGDGIDDIIVGASNGDLDTDTNSGTTYVVFGKSTSFTSTFDLSDFHASTFNGSTGFRLHGVDSGDLSGSALSSGDINNDGFDDLFIGAPSATQINTEDGEAYVFFGGSSISAVVDMQSVLSAGTAGFVLKGASANDNAGTAMGTGDLNGDGIDDLITGLPNGDQGGSNAGETYILFGKSSSFGSFLNASDLSGTAGFALNGVAANDLSGSTVASGDINGDGIDEIVIGAPAEADSLGLNRGEVYVFFNVGAANSIPGNEGYRMLSSPRNGAIFNELLTSFFTQGFIGSDAPSGDDNAFFWDQSTQAFTPLTNQNTNTLTAGHGFLFYLFSDDNGPGVAGDTGFPKFIPALLFGSNGTFNDGSITAVNDLADGDFFMAGNPYGFAIDWDSANLTKTNLSNTIYIWDDANSQFQSWNGTTGGITNGIIPNFQGFFIEASGGTGTLTFETSAISGTNPSILKQQAQTEPKILNLTAKAGDHSADAWLSFQEGGESGKDKFDGLSLQPLASTYLQLGTLEGEELLHINAQANHSETSTIFPLIIQGRGIAGEGFLTFEGLEDFDGWDIHILDQETGTVFPITEGSTFQFDVASINAKDVPKLTTPTPIRVRAKASSARYQLIMEPGVSVSTEEPSGLPSVVALDQNFPNPFNPTTNISFALPEAGDVKLQVFDLIGREVVTLVNGRQAAGRFTLTFNASSLSSGVYIYRLQAGGSVLTRKLTLIK